MITSKKIRNQMQDTSEDFGDFLEKVFEYVLQQEKVNKLIIKLAKSDVEALNDARALEVFDETLMELIDLGKKMESET